MQSQSVTSLQGPDYAILIGYFALMLGIGFYFYRYMRGMKMYFSGGNRIPWWLAGISFYMTSFSAFAFVSYSGLCYKFGLVGVTLFWVTVPATIFSVVFFATRWRRARIDSPVEYLESRYSHLFRQICVWEGIPLRIIDDSLKMIATGTIVHVGIGLGPRESIFWSGVVMLAYTFMGGLWAVTVTDFVQFVVLAAAVLILFPLSLAKVGGVQALVDNAPAGYFHWTTEEFNWMYVALLVVLYCVAYSSTNWSLIQKYYCVPKERDSLKLGWLVAGLNVIGPPLMFIPAICASQFLPGIEEDIQIYPRLCAALLPAGMLGLVIAAMFSATMSTLSSDFNVCASVLTNDVYRRLLHPHASERELVFIGRLMTLVVGAITIAVALALAGSSAVQLFKNMVTLFSIAAAPLGIPMLMGLLSKRATNLSAVLGLLLGVSTGLVLFFTIPDAMQAFGVHWEKETVLFAATAVTTLVTMVFVSSIAPMSAEERQRAEGFLQRLATPIGELAHEKEAAAEGHDVISPFYVVGICTALIGALMVGVLPWMGVSLAFWLDLALGLLFIVLGGITAWSSGSHRRPPTA